MRLSELYRALGPSVFVGVLLGSIAGCSGAGSGGLILSDDGGKTGSDTGSDAADAKGNPGDGAPAIATLSPSTIDFGAASCGGTAARQDTLHLSNTGGSPLTWSAEVAIGSDFAIAGASHGTVAPGGSTTIGVSVAAIPEKTTAGTVLTGNVTVTTSDAAHASFSVALSVTADGATLGVLPLTAAFGNVPLDVQAPDIPVTLSNTGNETALVTFDAPAISDFTVTWLGSPAALSIAPGATASATARFRPTSTSAATTFSTLHVTGAGVCGASSNALPMTGQGVTGVVALSPAELDFGSIDCGQAAAPQSLTLYNTGDAPYTWTSAFAKGADSPYELSPPAGTVAGGTTVTLSVIPLAIPTTSAVTADLYADSLVLTTDVLGDSPHTVTLSESAEGAILSLGVASLPFGSGAVGKAASLPVTITNLGNVAATVTVTTSGAPFGASPATPTSVAASGNLPATASFTPVAPLTLGPMSGALSVTATGALCAALPTLIPLTATASDTPTQVSAYGLATCVLATSGGAYCFGDDTYGELGDNGFFESDYATSVLSLASATEITTGYDFSCALVSGGTVECWGDNTYGELGNGTNNGSGTPVPVSISGATLVRGGESHACAVALGGAVQCWGSNDSGQLGNGTNNDSNVPVPVSGLASVTSLSLGEEHTCAVSAGIVYCWGDNTYGELGNGTNNSSTTPVQVTGLTGVKTVTAGDSATCALLDTGAVECWGDNTYGELGNGTNNSTTSPVAVTGLTNASAVDSTGGSHVCALLTTGGVVCWGSGTDGQLGDGVMNDSNVIVTVTGLSSVSAIATGSGRGCALTTGGSLLCWGVDQSGNLGEGTDGETALSPTAVVGL
jgi:alpha-tubulin suppressor-like RCC1 family protein